MTKWLPAGNKVLIKCDPISKTFKPGGRIEVPQGTVIERQEMKQMMGTVVAMGPLAYRDQVDDEGNRVEWVSVGDRVMFQQYAGWLHTEDDEPDTKYRVMHDLDIIMVLKQGEDNGNE